MILNKTRSLISGDVLNSLFLHPLQELDEMDCRNLCHPAVGGGLGGGGVFCHHLLSSKVSATV